MNGQIAAARSKAQQNLLTAALDVAFSRGLVRRDDIRRSFEFQLAGMDVIAAVRGDDDEIGVFVTVAPTELGRKHDCAMVTHAKTLAKVGSAYACGWLSRRTGTFYKLTGGYHATYAATAALAQMSIQKERRAERWPARNEGRWL
ncbi:hypothetical protein [Bradyrhizobium sp. 604_D8_N2_3]|uniref:hypothetical protein n=1 Tax=Bradyrhizobium sp. 604_D8_N2_3 TaxID=3240370 RepID=UPI003F28A6D6